MTDTVTVDPQSLDDAVREVFEALGFSRAAAGTVAKSLVDADLAGVASHGVMLVPMYVQRVLAGSVSRAEAATVVRDDGAVAVLDGGHALGQLTSVQAMRLATDKAAVFGLGAVAVRHAFHFGRAVTYAQMAADRGQIGLATTNTRPMMPAVGGATPVVGNNPLSVAVPGAPEHGFALDMALSEAALGKIRIAEAQGRSIPDTWATDVDGAPTTDPTEAIAGMMLPVGGPKGFGLALVVETLTGVLSGGSTGARVAGLYGDLAVPNDCSHFFLAIDPARFAGEPSFHEGLGLLTGDVLGSRPRPGVERVMLPGQPEVERAERARSEGVQLATSVLDGLHSAAEAAGTSLPQLARTQASS